MATIVHLMSVSFWLLLTLDPGHWILDPNQGDQGDHTDQTLEFETISDRPTDLVSCVCSRDARASKHLLVFILGTYP